METNTKVSLHSFAQTSGIAKSTLHRKAKELNIDTSSGLTAEDRQALIAAIQPKQNQRLLPGTGSASQSLISGDLVKLYQPPSLKDLLLRDLQQREQVLETVEAEVELVEAGVELDEAELAQLAEARRQQDLRMAQLQARKDEALRRQHEMELRKARELGKREASPKAS